MRIVRLPVLNAPEWVTCLICSVSQQHQLWLAAAQLLIYMHTLTAVAQKHDPYIILNHNILHKINQCGCKSHAPEQQLLHRIYIH